MKLNRTRLSEGIYLTCLPSDKFKTGVLSVHFVTPLRKETASARALIPSVLRRGTVSFPDMGSLESRLDGLYGAQVDSSVRKVGERQCIGFVASLIDDRFTPGGERLLEPVAELLGELLSDPVTEGGIFSSAYFESEKSNLQDAILSQMNDKRVWASRRLMEEMCADEAYGISTFGTAEDAGRLKNEGLWTQYRSVISTCPIEVIYAGSARRDRVEEAVHLALDRLPRKRIAELEKVLPHKPRGEVLEVEDAMDVTQGKLSMGFSCESDDFPAMLLGNSIFGGNSNSKLFLNVREKLSLCYYASSVYHRQKRLITVSSGIEFQNRQRAYDEILAQLEAVQRGQWEPWELEGARSTILSSYASMGDSLGRMENFCLSGAASEQWETPEELAELIRSVTEDRIIRAMETVRLDTVYFLRGKEAAE